MAEDNQNKKSKFALGAILGAAAGAVAGLLFAPKSGEDTREDLKRKAEELESEAKDKAGAAKSKAETTAREAKSTGRRLGDKAKGVYRAGREALVSDSDAVSKAKQTEAKLRAKDLKNDIKRTAKKHTEE